MSTLRSSGYFLWFAASMLAVSLLWPLTPALFLLVVSGDPGDATGIVDYTIGLLAAPFITLPFTVIVLLLATIVTLIPAAFGWWLGSHLADRTGLFGRKAAFSAGLGATVFWLLALVAAMTVSDRTGPLVGALWFGGPALVIAGPTLAVLLFHRRFPSLHEGGN
ncbi:hypothetical protein [Paracoccus sp. (in: a-proteobacteria)]|uniref:hypothetical protein n=1 Tax=Paracoccus sp. TaxID=267 RepID=UPI003A879F91